MNVLKKWTYFEMQPEIAAAAAAAARRRGEEREKEVNGQLISS